MRQDRAAHCKLKGDLDGGKNCIVWKDTTMHQLIMDALQYIHRLVIRNYMLPAYYDDVVLCAHMS